MKQLIFLLSLLLLVNICFGQAYIVTFIKGNVYSNKKPLKLHDKLESTTQISSSDKTAELALFSVQKGKLRLSFQDSKSIQAGTGAKSSELYRLIVADYIQTYTTEKTLTTRGGIFNLNDFFSGKNNNNRIFLVEGVSIPAPPTLNKFFICTIKNRDTICNQVQIKNGLLIFDTAIIKQYRAQQSTNPETINCLTKQGYIIDDKYSEQYYPHVSITFLTQKDLIELVDTYKAGLDTYYQNDKKKLITDIESQLSYYYGDYFERGLDQLLLDLVK